MTDREADIHVIFPTVLHSLINQYLIASIPAGTEGVSSQGLTLAFCKYVYR